MPCSGVGGGGGGIAETAAEGAGVRKEGGGRGASAAKGGTEGGRGASTGETTRGGAGGGRRAEESREEVMARTAGAEPWRTTTPRVAKRTRRQARQPAYAAQKSAAPRGVNFVLPPEPGTEPFAVCEGPEAFADFADGGREPSLAVESPREPSPAANAAKRAALCSSQAARTHPGMSDARPRDRMTFAATTPSRRTAVDAGEKREGRTGRELTAGMPLILVPLGEGLLAPTWSPAALAPQQAPVALREAFAEHTSASTWVRGAIRTLEGRSAVREKGGRKELTRTDKGGSTEAGRQTGAGKTSVLARTFFRGEGAAAGSQRTLGTAHHNFGGGFVLRDADGARRDLTLRASSRGGFHRFNDLHLLLTQLVDLRVTLANLRLDLRHRGGSLVFPLTLSALRSGLCLDLRERLAIQGVRPGNALIDPLPLHAGREPDGLAHQARSLICHLLRGLTTPDDVLRISEKEGAKGRIRHTSCARTRRAKSTYSSSPAILPPEVDLAAVDADMVVMRVGGWREREWGVEESDGGVPLFADSGTIAANDVACQRSVVSALRTRAAITKRANTATTHDRAARPGERSGKSHGKRGKFTFDFAFERSHRAAKIFGASERGDVAGPGAAEDAYRRVGAIVEQAKTFTRCEIHGFADFALRTEEAVPLDDQEGLIKGLTAKDHLDARRDRQKLAVASIIRQDQLRRTRAKAANTYHAIVQLILCLKPLLARARIRIHQAFQDGQLLKHLRARERRDFVANFDGATVKILQSRLHGEQGDAKNVSTLSQPRGRALIPPRYRARSHRWLNGDVQDLSEGEMMRPTNRHQRFSHTARPRPRPLRHSLARAKRLAGVCGPIDPREDSLVRARPRATKAKTCEGLRRPPRPQAAVSGSSGARRAVPSRGALAERGIDLRSVERRARKRSRAPRAVAACFRTVSVRPAKLAKPAKILSEVFPLSLSPLRREGRPTLAKTHRRRSPSQGTRHEPFRTSSPPRPLSALARPPASTFKRLSAGFSLSFRGGFDASTPTRALKGLTPYEARYGSPPDLRDLHRFGAKVWVHKESAGKTESKAREGRFVGYSQKSKGYQIYWPDKRSVTIERNVRFVEDEPDSVEVEDVQLEGAKADRGEQPTSSTSPSPTPQPPSETRPATPPPSEPSPSQTNQDNEEEESAPPEEAAGRGQRVRKPSKYVRRLQQGEGTVDGRTSAPPKGIQPAELMSAAAVTALATIVNVSDDEDEGMHFEEDEEDAAPHTPPPIPLEYGFAVMDHALLIHEGQEPRTLEEAKASPDWPQWEAAIDKEIKNLRDHNTYDLVEPPPNANIVGCRFVFRIKRDADGSITQFKARLVAQGYTQMPGVDFNETFAPVAKLSSIRTILALAARYDWELEQMDVKSAYLNGRLDEEIYMRQPPGSAPAGLEHLVCRLKKTLYGLKQAGRGWYKTLSNGMAEMGFTRCASDHAVWYKRTGDSTIIVASSVDDLTIAGTRDFVKDFKSAISARFEMSDLGAMRWILRIEVQRDRQARTIAISQRTYIDTVAARFNLETANPVLTPLQPGGVLNRS
ncbi:LOW QUALITY PROTEIN: hypothetical protein ACG7TL_002375 [Trametes sanguinea]